MHLFSAVSVAPSSAAIRGRYALLPYIYTLFRCAVNPLGKRAHVQF
jgi:alpha-glucosidase (family GH31 glycosyl hydrolase)